MEKGRRLRGCRPAARDIIAEVFGNVKHYFSFFYTFFERARNRSSGRKKTKTPAGSGSSGGARRIMRPIRRGRESGRARRIRQQRRRPQDHAAESAGQRKRRHPQNGPLSAGIPAEGPAFFTKPPRFPVFSTSRRAALAFSGRDCYNGPMNEKPVVGRFAPSPSGYLHLGNLLAMLLAWLDCRAQNGRLIFRLEDLDPGRSKQAYIDALAGDLRWLGLDWDEGWPDPAYAQSARTARYEAAFETLRAWGLVYPCWCSRAQRLAAASAPAAGEAQFDPACPCARLPEAERQRLLASGRRPAWKLRAPDREIRVADGHYGLLRQNPSREGGDFLIRRSDGVFAYQLAVCVDDLEMGVTRVVRGRDLLDSTPRQAWLIETLGGRAPSYCHAPLLAERGGKLSKRLGSLSTQELRREQTPEAVVGRLARLCGLRETEAPVTPRELLADFDWRRVKTEDIEIE